jgi:hypothetical protein
MTAVRVAPILLGATDTSGTLRLPRVDTNNMGVPGQSKVSLAVAARLVEALALLAVTASLVSCSTYAEPTAYPSPGSYPAPLAIAGSPTPTDAGRASSQPEGWQVYREPEYGFRVAYPAAWTVETAKPGPGLPRIGPPNVMVVALLMPTEWSERLARGEQPAAVDPSQVPLMVEITKGTWDQYRLANSTPTDSEQVSLNGLTAIREIDGPLDGAHVVRYLLLHPTRPDVRITVIDNLSGFPDRLAGNEELLATYQQVLATVAFDLP